MLQRVTEIDKQCAMKIIGYAGSLERANLRCMYRLVSAAHTTH